MNRTVAVSLLTAAAIGTGAAAALSASAQDGHATATPASAAPRPAADALVADTTTGVAATDPVAVTSKIQTARNDHEVVVYLTADVRGTLHYRTAQWVPGGPDNGHYQVGRLTHTARLAAHPTIRSAVNICSGGQVTVDSSGLGSKPCTTAQLAGALHSGNRPYATLRLDGHGAVTAVLEHYVP